MSHRNHRSLNSHPVVLEFEILKKDYQELKHAYKSGLLDAELTTYKLSGIQQKLDFLEVKLAMMWEQV
jgi:hypothetical protein